MANERSEGDRERVTRVVYETVAGILPAVPTGRITGDKHLKDLGADSVDRVEIVLALIDTLGVNAPMACFSNLPDIDSLVDFLVDAERT
ncbi:phosphopantetheine-binding protein [Streptomyces sp. NBC_01485]|uniref:phosphopantetheine-binding protein n=1 Tax=Streptomyces sp. NBC_01485 TaxID=2903884 RepID=UPI002E339A1B|nr:phosphopantetheine-binding protein [Streptomyces sp. NBC_01485]